MRRSFLKYYFSSITHMKRLLSFVLILCFFLASTTYLSAQSENLALDKLTRQSSVYGYGIASIAVDGDIDGSRGPWGSSPSIQHTQNELQPWWEVDLGSTQNIRSVKIYNRTDGFMNRLQDFYLLISDVPFSSDETLDNYLANPSITKEFYKGSPGAEWGTQLNTTGRYVRVQLRKQGILHMAEVEVWGEAGATSPCPEAEVLMDFFAATSSPTRRWIRQDNWGEGCPCENDWYGVLCNSEGKVVELTLRDNLVRGPIPASFGQLTSLKKLDLGGFGSDFDPFNRISELPESIGNLTKLEEIILVIAPIESLPSSMVNLTNLKVLELPGHSIPVFPEFLTQLTHLEKLNYLGFGGRIDSLPESIGNLINLVELKINELSCVPNSMLSFCERGVSVTKEGGATHIGYSTFCRDGSMACDPDNLPPFPDQCPEDETQYMALMEFYEATNGPSWFRSDNWGQGCPCENDWFGISCNEDGKVTAIILPQNILSGTVPDAIGDLAYLETLDLYRYWGTIDVESPRENYINSLSPAIGKLKRLKRLVIGGENFTRLPSTLGDLSALETLEINYAPLEELPANIGNLENLSSLRIFNDEESLSFGGWPPRVITLECFPASMANLCSRNVEVVTNDVPISYEAFCEEGSFSCDEPTCNNNLALGKSASQSSVYGQGEASIAVDGDRDGSRGPWGNDASIQHTQNEFQPWWEVDLGEEAAVKSVHILNRSNFQFRLKAFYVFLAPQPFAQKQVLKVY